MPRELKQETYEDIAAISAFIRRNAFIYGTDLADRLDAAWKRQMSQSWHHREMEELIAKHEKEVAELKKQTGNSAALREALVLLTDAVREYLQKGLIQLPLPIEEANAKARSALSAPARNCDLPLVVDGPAYKNADKAWLVFKQHNHDAYFDVFWLLQCIDWLLAPAAERVVVSKTETTTVGNAAALRDALEKLVEIIDKYDGGSPMWWHSGAKGAIPLKNAKAALSSPPRNCDIHPKRDEASRAFQETVLTERERERAKKYPLAVMDWFIDWLLATQEGGEK